MSPSSTKQVGGVGAARRRPVRRRARRVDRQRRAALDRDRPRVLLRRPVMGRQRLRARVRRLPAARRSYRRPAGRRRLFVSGLILFAAASLAGGLAQSAGWLVAARAVQGLGAALLSPAALSL